MSKSTSFAVLTKQKNLNMEVRRMYSDFVALHTGLKQRFYGIVLPPLPPNMHVHNFSSNEGQVQKRQFALQFFMSSLVTNPFLLRWRVTNTHTGEKMKEKLNDYKQAKAFLSGDIE